jgi:hypothetical protein
MEEALPMGEVMAKSQPSRYLVSRFIRIRVKPADCQGRRGAWGEVQIVQSLSGQHDFNLLLEFIKLPGSSYYDALKHPKVPTLPEVHEYGMAVSESCLGEKAENKRYDAEYVPQGSVGHLKEEFFKGESWEDFETFKRNREAHIVH